MVICDWEGARGNKDEPGMCCGRPLGEAVGHPKKGGRTDDRSGRLSFEHVFRDDGSTGDGRGKWKHRHSLNLVHDHVNIDTLPCT
jgi:hypothetical protein